MKIQNLSRRKFLKQAVLVGGLSPLIPKGLINLTPKQPSLEIHIFSKHLQFLEYTDMAGAAAALGFDGVDLTVRPGGHVLPEKVTEDLPKAVEAIQQARLKASMMTTAVTDANSHTDRSVLETASGLGYEFYRMGYLHYDDHKPMMDSMEEFQQAIKGLSEMNRRLGLIGCYQNHAGRYAGASMWEKKQMLATAEIANMGSQYDIRHALVEGGLSWENGLRLISPHIKTLALKDYKWEFSQDRWRVVNTPIGEGMVDFSRYFTLLKQYNIHVPACLHYEYPLGGVEHGRTQITESEATIYKAMKKDLETLRALWENA
ncbi:MAG: TIM barrel protein [Balneolales bacterium]